MTWFLRVFLIALSLTFMATLMVVEWRNIQTTEWNFQFGLLGLSLGGVVLLFFLDAFGWHLILKSLGHDVPAIRTMQVWMLSSLARYIPGGIWSFTSRVALAKAEGIDVTTASTSLFIETLLLMASSLAIGSLALLWDVGVSISPWVAGVVCFLPALVLHPRVVALAGRSPGRVGRMIQGIRLPTMRRTMWLYIYYLIFWVLFGIVFVGFVSATHPVSLEHWIPVGAGIALGFFVGFVAIVVPGGIGVRESVLYLLLLPFLPAAASLVVAMASRLWIMAAEAISLLAVVAYGRLGRRAP